MDFSSSDYGVNIPGMTQYIEDINSIVLTKVAPTLRDTSKVKEAVDAGWVGQSADRFKSNLDKAAEDMVENLKKLEKAFETELKGIQSQMLDLDANLVDDE